MSEAPICPLPVGHRRLKNGYVEVKVDPDADRWHGPDGYGWILEHRLIFQKQLGRRLYPNEEVHHKNGDRKDNRLRNLELWNRSHPPGQRVEDLVKWARDILAKYGNDYP